MITATYLPESSYKLYLPSITIKYLIDTREVVRIQSMSNYSKLFFRDGKTLVVAKVLGWFEQKLLLREFVRVHRTHLINTDYISKYRPGNGSAQLELTNGEMINVSRRKAGFLKSVIVQ